MESIIDTNDDWQEVNTSKKYNKNKKEKKILGFDDLIKILYDEFKIFDKIVAGYLYGSRARKTNKVNSDVDIIIFMKIILEDDILKEFKEKLELKLNLKVDLVVCHFKNKWIDHTDLRDQCYFDNIIPDAYQFTGKHEDIKYLISTSIKLPKI